jgi:sec-independent protein translocase protein TatB
VFGVSFTEFGLILLVILIVVGPQKLPGMMRTLGQWLGRFRRMTTEMRVQSGIDDVLRQEGLAGGLTELRAIVRGELGQLGRPPLRRHAANRITHPDPYAEALEPDLSREYPVEGPDAYGALAEDLVALTSDIEADEPHSTPTSSPPASPKHPP